MKLTQLILAAGLAVACTMAAAKIPPPPPAPPEDPKAAAEKAEKAKATAEKTKALQVGAEERAVKNFQSNMKKAGKPVPKPTPIVVAQAPGAAPAKGAPAAPNAAAKPAKK